MRNICTDLIELRLDARCPSLVGVKQVEIASDCVGFWNDWLIDLQLVYEVDMGGLQSQILDAKV